MYRNFGEGLWILISFRNRSLKSSYIQILRGQDVVVDVYVILLCLKKNFFDWKEIGLSSNKGVGRGNLQRKMQIMFIQLFCREESVLLEFNNFVFDVFGGGRCIKLL